MAARRTAGVSARSSTTKKAAPKKAATRKAATKRSAKTATKRKVARTSTARPTLAGVSAQLVALSEQVEALTQLVRTLATSDGVARAATASVAVRSTARDRDELDEHVDAVDVARSLDDGAAFDADLLKVFAELDRHGRHAGMVPIPEVRSAFLQRGWTRRTFDDRLLQAERDFVVDLKTANDPARLTEPELAIEEPGRGHLQYVVLR